MKTAKVVGRELATGEPVCILIENDTIVSISPSTETTDVWLSAGLIDLQVNGYLGIDLNGPNLTPQSVSALVRRMLAAGVTTFLPTLITASEESIVQRLACIAKARMLDPIAAVSIPSVHVEGPYISELDGYRGAHPLEWVRPPSVQEFDRWQSSCGNLVGLVTLSPHFLEAPEYIDKLTQRGVHVALGHTHASPPQIHQAVHRGARLSTHVGNGIALKLDRHPNPIWSQLAEDQLTATFIADSHHLPAETLKVMIAAKGLERSILVSDTVALAGMPPGRYTAPIGGQLLLSPEGRLSMEGTSSLAGSVVPLISCIGHAVQMTGLPLADAMKMATVNPGRFVSNRGLLQPGERADILQFHWNEQESKMTVQDVWVAGIRLQEIHEVA